MAARTDLCGGAGSNPRPYRDPRGFAPKQSSAIDSATLIVERLLSEGKPASVATSFNLPVMRIAVSGATATSDSVQSGAVSRWATMSARF
jgi:hypothetical protein